MVRNGRCCLVPHRFAAKLMRELAWSSQGATGRFALFDRFGSHYPGTRARIRFHSDAQLHHGIRSKQLRAEREYARRGAWRIVLSPDMLSMFFFYVGTSD